VSLRVGVLGAGYFARFHHEAWQRLEGAELVGVADLDLERAAEAGAPAFENVADLLAKAQPDILDIATPPPTHATAIRAGLSAGVKAIICQKPFCASFEEARAIADEAQAAGIPLIVHENIRFQPWYRCMRDIVQRGALGDIHQMTFRLRTGDGQGPHAYLDRQPYFQKMPRLLIHETAVHWVDTFRFFLGPVRAVYADLRRMNPAIAGEDAGYVIFEFDEGKRAIFDGNRHLDHAADNHRLTLGEAALEGTRGSLTLDGFGEVVFRGFMTTERDIALPRGDWPGFAGDCVHALQAHVLAGLHGEGGFENLAQDYLEVRRVEKAIYASAERGERVEL